MREYVIYRPKVSTDGSPLVDLPRCIETPWHVQLDDFERELYKYLENEHTYQGAFARLTRLRQGPSPFTSTASPRSHILPWQRVSTRGCSCLP